jgi:hypothetical protein
LGEYGVGRWIAVFYHGRGGHQTMRLVMVLSD